MEMYLNSVTALMAGITAYPKQHSRTSKCCLLQVLCGWRREVWSGVSAVSQCSSIPSASDHVAVTDQDQHACNRTGLSAARPSLRPMSAGAPDRRGQKCTNPGPGTPTDMKQTSLTCSLPTWNACPVQRAHLGLIFETER